MSKMIPLHIADQAVAACEAEIQKLREENARLRKAGNVLENCIRSADMYREAYHRNWKLTPREIAAVDVWQKARDGGQP